MGITLNVTEHTKAKILDNKLRCVFKRIRPILLNGNK